MAIALIHLDFETKSYADLKKVGAWAYSEHETTEVIVLCWAIDGGAIDYWLPSHGRPMPEVLRDAIAAGEPVEAHNCSFEISIWKNVMVKRYGWADIPVKQWRDTMAVAHYYALPGGLDKLARVLGLPGKNPEGARLITKYSKLHLKTAKPVIPPEDMKKWIAYCTQDVEEQRTISNYLGDLPDDELALFHLDLKIELRGLKLDHEGIAAASEVVDKRAGDLEVEFRKLTGVGPNQREKVLAWFAGQGFPLENLQAEYLEELVEEGNVPAGSVRRALSIRLSISKASTKKLDKMVMQSGADCVARFQCKYHGAQTGRWTGTGFQPLNMNRGSEDSVPEDLVANIMTRSPKWLDALYGDAMQAVSWATRHWITAKEGNRILAGDFVSIEAVVLACLAGEEWKVKAFRDGVKIYEAMADKIYNLPPGTVTKKTHPLERQDGKTCFAAGTRVLTRAGWKDIVSVTFLDEVWDGVEWVRTGGAICQGIKETIDLLGVGVTSDHKILCGHEWRPASVVALLEPCQRLALETGSENLPSEVQSSALSGASWECGCGAPAAGIRISSRNKTCATGKLHGATAVPSSSRQSTGRTTTSTQTSFLTTPTVGVFLTAFQRASRAVGRAATKTMGHAASVFLKVGAGVQRVAASTWPISYLCPAGTTLNWRSTASTSTKGMSPAICALLQEGREKSETLESCSNASSNSKPVYDVVNAGPRNRFTVLTAQGPVIAHNCELAFGYQGALNAWLNFDSSGRHTDERIIEICKAWRKEHPEIVGFWYAMERAAIKAVETGREVECGPISFKVIDEWLSMRLPDGKRIWYWAPELRVKMPKWHDPATKEDCAAGTCRCEPQPQLTYMAQKFGAWKRVTTYGGKLVENATQATARQILTPSMLRVERYGYPIVLSVYDEVVCDTPLGHGSIKEFEAILGEREGFFRDWPIGVDCWEGQRYKK